MLLCPQQPRRPTHKIRQACDPCRVRKIRCDGTSPCLNCQRAGMQCTYNTKLKKTGPKGRRFRKDATGVAKRPIIWPQPPVSTIEPAQVIRTPTQGPLQDSEAAQAADEPSIGPSGFQPSCHITVDIIKGCLDAFFAHKYPIMPILDKRNIYADIPRLHLMPEQYGLITALCAIIFLEPDLLETSLAPDTSSSSLTLNTVLSVDFLIGETCQARRFSNHIEDPSLTTVQTSFFLFAACFGLGRENSAWFYIRESMTMLQLLSLHEETTYSAIADQEYLDYCRRTFWLLFVTERAYAIQRHRPLTLHSTICLPVIPPGREATILSGFLNLISLFRHFNNNFLSLWNPSVTDSAASPQSLVKLQTSLKAAIPGTSEATDIQQADLIVTRQWLKIIVWQLCVKRGFLSSSPSDESISFHYPVSVARDIVTISRELPLIAFDANGVGILEKIFDIGCTLADVLLLIPMSEELRYQMIGPSDYLLELVRILGTVLGGRSKYLGVLVMKAEECFGMRIDGILRQKGADPVLCGYEDEADTSEEQAIIK